MYRTDGPDPIKPVGKIEFVSDFVAMVASVLPPIRV
jgi:hypothetical protein